MPPWLQTAITIICSVMASSGFWAYLQRRDNLKGAHTQLLLGLAHDRIIHLGMNYIERGYLTKDEYEDFEKYLYQPYSEFGGNGLAEKVMNDVKRLPIYTKHRNITPNVPVTQLGASNDRSSN